MEEELPAVRVLHHEIQLIWSLEGVFELDDEGTLAVHGFEDLALGWVSEGREGYSWCGPAAAWQPGLPF